MAINGSVTLSWGDGEHTFNIAKLKCVLELEEKCGCGVREIFNRIRTDRWFVNDLRETIRLGLIGGGMPSDKALRSVVRYFDDSPMIEHVRPAFIILGAALIGVPGDEVGKKPAPDRAKSEDPPSTAQMEASSDLSSTATERPSDSTREPRAS